MGPNIFVGESECVYPTPESCIKTYEKTKGAAEAKTHCENKTIIISSFTKEKYTAEVAGIGNVQLFVNLVFILYARWRFKTKLASLIISVDFQLQFSTNVARFARRNLNSMDSELQF